LAQAVFRDAPWERSAIRSAPMVNAGR